MKRIAMFLMLMATVVLLGGALPATAQQTRESLPSENGSQDFGPQAGAKVGKGFGVDYAFKGTGNGNQDGALPTATPIQDPAGNLYGTTSQGGDPLCNPPNGCGTVYRIDPRKRETVLWAFHGSPADGAVPTGRLVMDGAGNLYGTTSSGGAFNLGTVFKIDASGAETVLYSFAGGSDGANPYAGLVMDGAGDLYGTTENGGASNLGTVFEIDASGNETVLHSFAGAPNDGADPKAGLTFDPAGNLYGTTFAGGLYGFGTVFELAPDGTETILWNFTGDSDGANPFGGVIRDAKGVLYGTAENGGKQALLSMIEPQPYGHYGCCRGTGYQLIPQGMGAPYTFDVLYTFTGGKDGGAPACDLVLSNGVLYGTTAAGGPGGPKNGKGTAFSLTIATKTETVLHGFRGALDGGSPQSGLLLNGAGVLYGTAMGGGKNQKGTVFHYKLK